MPCQPWSSVAFSIHPKGVHQILLRDSCKGLGTGG